MCNFADTYSAYRMIFVLAAIALDKETAHAFIHTCLTSKNRMDNLINWNTMGYHIINIKKGDIELQYAENHEGLFDLSCIDENSII